MAIFNIGEVLAESTVDVDSGRRLDISEGGVVRGRNTFTASVYSVHLVIQTDFSGRVAIDDFYNTYSNAWNTVTVDGIAYTALFRNRPKLTGKDGSIRYVEVDMVGYTV